jgi:hypothetical protein
VQKHSDGGGLFLFKVNLFQYYIEITHQKIFLEIIYQPAYQHILRVRVDIGGWFRPYCLEFLRSELTCSYNVAILGQR